MKIKLHTKKFPWPTESFNDVYSKGRGLPKSRVKSFTRYLNCSFGIGFEEHTD